MKYFATKISNNIAETAEGFLLCPGVSIARTGEQEYMEGETPLKGKNGKVIVDRPEKEVFDPKTIASFEGKCFTIEHPENFVSKDNFKDLSVGHIQNVRRGTGDQKDDLVADVLIKDADAILLVKDGMRGLSCGYEAEYIQIEDGRGEQRNIRGNHLALVDEGRAGPSYAINDHKGDSFMSKITKVMGEKLKAAFSKTVDEALMDDEAPKEDPKKDEPKKDDSKDTSAYDALMKQCADFMETLKGMKEAKDADAPVSKKDEPKKEEPAKDEDVNSSLEDMLKSIESRLAKLEEKQSTGDDDGDDDVMDADEDDVIIGDTGDTLSRAEILAPGIKVTKDVKAQALKAAYKTADGKKVIDALTGGKPKFEDAKQVDMIFIASSEILKSERKDELADSHKNRVKDFKAGIFNDKNEMTAEKMNQMNAEKYGLNK